MRLNRKTLGRIATTFVATAMLATFAAVPAMAADNDQVQLPAGDAASISQITIDKVLQKPLDVYAPSTTFSFDVAPSDDAVAEGALISNEYATGTRSDGTVTVSDLEVYRGVTGGVTKVDASNDGKATFAPEESDLTVNSVIEQFHFTVDATRFTHAGVYKYKVTETAGNVEGITYDTTSRILYVYVENDQSNPGNFQVVGAVVKGKNNSKTDRITNKYLTDGTNPDMDQLYITKDVQGKLGSLTDGFSFTVTIASNVGTSSAGATEQYHAVFEKYDSEKQTWALDTSVNDESAGINDGVVTLNTDTSANIKLKDNQRLHIYGLSDNDQYTIVENDGNENGYSTAVTGNVQDEDEVTQQTEHVKVEGTVNPEAAAVKNITYTNTRDSVTPTGVLMNVAPYALMVIIAVAAAFVFLRKRRDD